LAIFVPYAVPGVVATLMWGYLYGPDFGPFAQISNALGLGAPPFLTQTGMLFSIMNIVNWSFIGYNMIIIYAALRSLPSELYEAARVDGASEPRIAWSIKIPAVRPALLLTVIFSVIGTFQLFTEPKLMFTLAPNVIGTAWSPNLYAYNVAFVNQDANYAAAVGRNPARRRTSWLLTVFVLICVGYFLLPLFWLVVASTKSNADLFSTFGLWFANFNLFENIKTVLTFQDGVYVRWALNSVFYAVVTSVGAAFLATAAGYAFAKYKFPGGTALFAIILGAIMVP